ncbi:hypothetical protein JHK82_017987 [Glycine max]|uniref:LEAF RUST 10 DISEASE-RESISTANCE LOCUS RECEPTOR-LIKE PROTEIN KINASE-like 2.1 isoform X2 n=1 Tax=Glycine soja TaxID=3848 RepID=UPI00103FAE5E|nr:LEAF RUST 10 DISEASE-RESISTANCE LOCUS RECEPTOR-LIKE PROTEIN KINASE-like 2.1 isoform X2 [Glycine soja]KAG5037217.1 hypothetical protein JHK86_018057 [Glycine max]KAG5142292.1 hypothetical protein JHK82_017987 [Glycine max]
MRARETMDCKEHIPMLRTVVLTVSWLLLITLLYCEAAYNYSECKEQTYKCGSLINISYPFWGHDQRDSECGGGDLFELKCYDDDTTLLIGSQNYTVKEINIATYTMRLVRTDLARDVCSPQFGDTYLNPTLFSYPPEVHNVTIFYDCTPITNPQFPNSITCGYAVPNIGEGFQYSLIEQCKRRLHVPTDDPEVDYGGGKNSAVEKALDKGFEVKYTVSQDCTTCLGSEGNCSRHDAHFYQNLCHYCPDGSHALHCSKRKIHWTMKLILGITAGVMGGFMICIIICSTKCMSSTKVKLWFTLKNDQGIESFLKHHGALAQKRYKFSEVKKMTNSFKVKLGEGGFGAVYKGELLSGCPVAVKILNASKGNGEDFINEVASISRTSHVNVVTLLGFSSEGRKKALIYEFLPNGSLDKFIYNKGLETTASLCWDNFWQIAIGTARGLEYLHRGCNTRILHFDIKPHNILLDENFCPKISDFGLAKLCPMKESIISMSDARGTIGYVAPEVWNRNFGGISQKSDVYSYGMMLLEMVGVKKNINGKASQTSEYFPDWIYNRLEQGIDLTTDGVIATQEKEIARRMTIVGLWCVQTIPQDRPTMSKVIDMLEGNMDSLEMPPKPVLSSPARSLPEFTTSSLQSG